MKLVVNMIMGGMMAIFCEGLALGQKAGLEAVDILEVIDAGAMSNPLFLLKGGLIGKKGLHGCFSPEGPASGRSPGRYVESALIFSGSSQ